MSSIIYPSPEISFDHGTFSWSLLKLILFQTGCPIFIKKQTCILYKKRGGGGIRRKLNSTARFNVATPFFGFWIFFVPFLIHFVYLFDIIKISMFFLSLFFPLISPAWHCFLLNVQHQNEWTQNRVLSRYLKIKLCHFALHFCWLFLILHSSRYLQMFFQSLFNEILQFQFFCSCEADTFFFWKIEVVRYAIGLLNFYFN